MRGDFYGWNSRPSPDEVDDLALLDRGHVEKLFCIFESRASGRIGRVIDSGLPPVAARDRYHLSRLIAKTAPHGAGVREDLSQVATYEMRWQMLKDVEVGRFERWLSERT